MITLAIIGIIAALTLPPLITKHQKQVTVNKLKKAYSQLLQAVKMSEIYNGDIYDWDDATNNAKIMRAWVDKYIIPYIKYTKTDILKGEKYYYVRIWLADGTVLRFSSNGTGNLIVTAVYLNGIDKTEPGKDYFQFYIGNCAGGWASKENFPFIDKMPEVRPIDYVESYQVSWPKNRNFWKDDTGYGCNPSGRKTYCAMLIMLDGWKISDDYPW